MHNQVEKIRENVCWALEVLLELLLAAVRGNSRESWNVMQEQELSELGLYLVPLQVVALYGFVCVHHEAYGLGVAYYACVHRWCHCRYVCCVWCVCVFSCVCEGGKSQCSQQGRELSVFVELLCSRDMTSSFFPCLPYECVFFSRVPSKRMCALMLRKNSE